jgi:hypothetical protein
MDFWLTAMRFWFTAGKFGLTTVNMSRGQRYPDMPWEPKAAFTALAELYRALDRVARATAVGN